MKLSIKTKKIQKINNLCFLFFSGFFTANALTLYSDKSYKLAIFFTLIALFDIVSVGLYLYYNKKNSGE